MLQPFEEAWRRLGNPARTALASAWDAGVPGTATALYARWWQLETWLRTLANVELRARDGIRWTDALIRTARDREMRDRKRPYMASPDGQSQLAFLDVAPLFELLSSNWELFGESLLGNRTIWQGRAGELQTIRNRIGHCRRPDVDDPGRLEQTLRDLGSSAFLAAAALNDQEVPDRGLEDPLVAAWRRGQHGDANLIEHAARQYDVRFSLAFSRRPWAPPREDDDPVTGRVGYLWHARWVMRGTNVDLAEFWHGDILDEHRHHIVLVCANSPARVEVSFAAMDDPPLIADAIGSCFDAVLSHDSRYSLEELPDWDTWTRQTVDLDPRVQIRTPWSEALPGNPYSVFGV